MKQQQCLLCGQEYSTGLNVMGCLLCFPCERKLLSATAAEINRLFVLAFCILRTFHGRTDRNRSTRRTKAFHCPQSTM